MSKLITRAIDLAGQENNDEPEHDLIQELAERLRAVEKGLCVAFRELEKYEEISIPSELWALHDDYLDGSMK